MRDAMIAGVTLNVFNNHADRVRMANLAQTVNVLQAVILTDEEKMLVTPTYHVMKMYNVHQDAVLLPTRITTADYELGDEKLPAFSVSASRDAEGLIHVSLVNIDARQSRTIAVEVRGASFSSAEAEILTSARVQDHNTFEEPDQVEPAPFQQFKQVGNTLEATVPPFSVVVFALK